jgi:hypothetical protein
MKPIGILSLSLLAGLVGGSASAQEIQNLVHVSAANQSANAAVTRAIADYIAARNNATVVQAMARSVPDKAPTMTVEALLAAIESNARIVEPVPAAVTPAPEAPPPPAKKKVVKKGGSTGGSGGAGGGASGGGGGGW